eukprot:gnl/Spiro4/13806_TR7369_c0_g1_i1.p1 gnl/Spiro4/13806_TR7369_c0_g1~~gnl/Spiro4/13806_TR7369_c0_g1_i1.p1  ORF type:complete len:245 (-),score=55.43 gnl/Spiro4/13806_TR7369_c0_g1_i1:162-896(-)
MGVCEGMVDDRASVVLWILLSVLPRLLPLAARTARSEEETRFVFCLLLLWLAGSTDEDEEAAAAAAADGAGTEEEGAEDSTVATVLVGPLRRWRSFGSGEEHGEEHGEEDGGEPEDLEAFSSAAAAATAAPPASSGGAASSPRDRENIKVQRGGVFSVSSTSSKTPAQIMVEIRRVLDASNIKYRVMSDTVVKASTDESLVKFEMEITALANFDRMYVVRLHRLDGDIWMYKEICKRLLNSMNL